jgi:hypothetical protein
MGRPPTSPCSLPYVRTWQLTLLERGTLAADAPRTSFGISSSKAEPERHRIDDFFAYVWALVGTVMETQSNQHLHSDDCQRTIYIDTLGVGTTDFGLSDERKVTLAESGRTHTEKYFAWYDDPKSQPANRPEVMTPRASLREGPRAPRTPAEGRARTAIRRRRS